VTTDFDPKKFYDGLVESGLIIPSGVLGVFGRSAVFEDVVERFNALVSRTAEGDGAEVLLFPPVVPRTFIEKNDYLDSFPHLAGSVFSFFGKDKEAKELSETVHAGKPWAGFLSQTDVCLTPAICYPVYPASTGTLPEQGRLCSVLGWAFRHEPSLEPTRLQSFRMREFIRIGTPDQVVDWRNQWLERGIALLKSLGLPVISDVASDPFFGRAGRFLAASQKEQRLKFEVLLPIISEEKPTAICSFNYHQDHFGLPFNIKTAAGEVAHSACLGFGLERCVMGLFKVHGFDPKKWPAEVRARLWP
jgi:seryl-tRNA synthetase